MSFQGGFADGFGTVTAEPAPPGRGGGGPLLLPRVWRPWPPLAPPPPPPRPPVRTRVRIRVAAPRLSARVVSTTLFPAPMRAGVRSAVELVGPVPLVMAWKAERAAREAKELAEINLALTMLGALYPDADVELYVPPRELGW